MEQRYCKDSSPYTLQASLSNTSPSLRNTQSLFANSNLTSSQNCSQFFTTSNSHLDSQDVTESTFSPYWIGNILEAMALNDDAASNKAASCSCGEASKGQFYCQDCNKNLCENCVSGHRRFTLTKTHNIVEAGNVQSSFPLVHSSSPQAISNSCKLHVNELPNFFCETCVQPICLQCTLFDHKEHRFQLLDQVVDANKTLAHALVSAAKLKLQRIESTIQEVQRTIESVVNKSQFVQSEIHSAVHKHIMALKQREIELTNKVDQIKLFKCQLLSRQMEHLQLYANRLKHSMDNVNDVIKTNDGVQILKAKEMFENDIASCGDSEYVAEDDGILFVHPDASLLLAIGSLGKVRSSVCAQQSVLCRDGSPHSTVLCGSTVIFSIHSRDHSGTMLQSNCDAFDVSVRKPDNTNMQVKPLDSGGGRFVFHIVALVEGDYVVSVQCRGVAIQDSPQLIKVKRSANYKSRSLLGSPKLVFGKEGDKPGELCRPWGICCDAKGFLMVADRSNNRIQIFNPDGTFHHMFGSPGTRHGQFDRPAGVAVDNKGHIIVVDKDNHRVQIFRFDGSFVSAFGEKGSKAGQFNYPWDVDVNETGIIVVTDTRNHRIQLFSFDGKFLNKYGFEGAMWKHFDSPRGVAFTRDNRLIVTDFNNHRLVIINPDMKSARYLGSEGNQTSQFLRPQGVAVDEEGNIVVADSRNHRLQVFTPSGVLLAVFGGNAPDDGGHSVQMDRPSGVAITPDNHIAVIDFGNNRVILY